MTTTKARLRAAALLLPLPLALGACSASGVAGTEADVVHYSLETDITRLVDEGLVAEDWKNTPTRGIATSSVVVLVVREGNPLGIETWDDLVEGDVEVITPNPGSSGSARWNILAAWAHVVGNGGSEEEAGRFLAELLDAGFDADLTAASGFRPVVDGVDVPDVEGANDPTDPFPAPESLFTIDDLFGGWATAAGEFFGDGEDGNPLGIVTRIQQRTGKVGEQ
jgi:ABC-type sulfate transport system substrate-binding protein